MDINRKVSAGEYCTLVRAKELGILNKDAFENTIKAPFKQHKDLKTFIPEVDAKDNRTKTLCKTVVSSDASKTEAYPHCVDTYGPGFVKRASTDAQAPFKCQVYGCPPGFTPSGEFCSKEPMYKDALIDKRSRCDERWYDWFLLPNYHIGNKYWEESVGKCYVPCPDNYLPNSATDVADGSSVGFMAEDDLKKCVPRLEYFAGKYADGSDYCPLAWIMRLYSCNDANVKQMLKKRRNVVAEANEGHTTSYFNVAMSDEQISKEAGYITAQTQRILENVQPPKDATLTACNTLNTKERLDQAYDICNQLNTYGNLELVGGAEKGNRDALNQSRNTALRQACNAVFCNEQVGSLDVIGKEPICFDKPAKIDPVAMTMSDEEASAPLYNANQSFLFRSFKILVYIVLISIACITAYTVFDKLVWPYTRRIFYKILGLFTGKTYAYVFYYIDAMDELNRKIANERMKGNME